MESTDPRYSPYPQYSPYEGGQDLTAPALPPSVSFTEAANSLRPFGLGGDPATGTPAEGLPRFVTMADGSRMSAEEMVRRGGAYVKLYDAARRIQQGEGYGFLDAFTSESAATLFPFFGMFASVGGDISDAADVKNFYEKRLRGEPTTEDELVKATLYGAENRLRADGSFGYMVGSITKQMPGFMVEMGALGSLAGRVRTGMAESAVMGSDATAAARYAFNGAMKTGMREGAVNAVRDYVAASGKSASEAVAELLASKTAFADAVGETVKVGQTLVDQGANAVRGFKPKWAPGLFDKALQYQAEESVRSAASLLSGDTKLARYWAGLKDSVVRAAKGGLADVGSWGTDSSTVLTSAETSWKRAALDGITELTVGAAARGAELFLPRTAVTKALESLTGAVSRSELDLVQTAGERGDRDLMDSAWLKGLAMDLMEYVSENTGRGFNSIGRALGLKFAPGLTRPGTRLAGARFTTGAKLARDASGKLEHVEFTGIIEQARQAEAGSRLSKLAEARWGRRAMDEKVAADKYKAVEWMLGNKHIRIDNPAALQATLSSGTVAQGLSSEIAQELGRDVNGYARGAVRAMNKAGVEGLKFDHYFTFTVADYLARHNLDPLSAWNAFQRAGYDGVFSEMLEERYSDVFGAMFGLNAYEDQSFMARMKRAWEAKWPGMQQFLVELVGFSVPMVARAGMMRGIAALGGKNEFEKRMDYASLYRDANRFGVGVLQQSEGSYLKAHGEQVKRLSAMETDFRDRVDDVREGSVGKAIASAERELAEARENAEHARSKGDGGEAARYESTAAKLAERLSGLEAVSARYAEMKAARKDRREGAAAEGRVTAEELARLGVQDEARALELEAEADRARDAVARARDIRKAFYDSLSEGQLSEIAARGKRVSETRARAQAAREEAAAARAAGDETRASALDARAREIDAAADRESLGGPVVATPTVSDEVLLRSRARFSSQAVPTEAQARRQLSASQLLAENAAEYAQGSYKLEHRTDEENAGWFRRVGRWVAESAMRLGGFAATGDLGFLSDNPLDWNARDKGLPGGLLDLLKDGYARAYTAQLRAAATQGTDGARGVADTASAHDRALAAYKPEAKRIVSEWLARKQVRMFADSELRDFAIDSVARSHGLYVDADTMTVRSATDPKAPATTVADYAAAHEAEVEASRRDEARLLYLALTKGEGADAVFVRTDDAAHAVQSVLAVPSDLPTADQAMLAQMAVKLPSLRDVLLVKDVEGDRLAADELAGPSTSRDLLDAISAKLLPDGAQILSVADFQAAMARAGDVDQSVIATVARDLGYDRLADGTPEGVELRNRAVVRHALIETLTRDPDTRVFSRPVSERTAESDRLGAAIASLVIARKTTDGKWVAHPGGSKSAVVTATADEMAQKLADPEYGYRPAAQRIVYGSIRDLRSDDPVKMIKALNLGDEYIRLMRESGADENEIDPLLRIDPATGQLYTEERAEEIRVEEKVLADMKDRAHGQGAEAYLLPGESPSDTAAMARADTRRQRAEAAHNRLYGRHSDTGKAQGYRAIADDLLARNSVSVPWRRRVEADVSPAFRGKYVFHARALQAIGASADIYIPVDHQNAQSYDAALLGVALTREFARHRGFAEGMFSRYLGEVLGAFDRTMASVRDTLAKSDPDLSLAVEELRLATVAHPPTREGIRKLSPMTFTEFVSAFNLFRTEVDGKHLVSELGPHATALKAVAPQIRKLPQFIGWTGFVDRMLGGDGFEVNTLRAADRPPAVGRGLAKYWALFAPAGSGSLYESVKSAMPGNGTWTDFVQRAAAELHAAANPQAVVVNTTPSTRGGAPGFETGVGEESEFADVAASGPLRMLHTVQDLLARGEIDQSAADAWLAGHAARASEMAGDTVESDSAFDSESVEPLPPQDPYGFDYDEEPWLDVLYPEDAQESPPPVGEDGAPGETGFAQGGTVGYSAAEAGAVADTVASVANMTGAADGVPTETQFLKTLALLAPAMREADREAMLESFRRTRDTAENPAALWMDADEDSDDEEGVLPDGFEGTNSRAVAMLRSQAMRQLNAIASVVSPHTGRDFLPFAEDVRNELGQFDRVFPADARMELGEERAKALDSALEYVRWILEPQREDVEGGASEREALFHARVAMMDTKEGRRKVAAHVAALMAPAAKGSSVPAFARAAVLLGHLMRLSASPRTRALRDQLASLVGEGTPSNPLRTRLSFTRPSGKDEAPEPVWSIGEAGGRNGEVSSGFVTSSFARLRGLDRKGLLAVRNRLTSEFSRMAAAGEFSSAVLWNRKGTGVMNAWARLLAPVFGADSPLVAVMTARDMYVGLYNSHRRSAKAGDLWSTLLDRFGLPKGRAGYAGALKVLLDVIDSVSIPEGGRVTLDAVSSAALDVVSNGAPTKSVRSVDSAVNSMHGSTEWMRLFQAYADARPRSVMTGDTDPERTSRPTTSVAVAMVGREPALTQFLDRKPGDNGAEDVIREWFPKYIGGTDAAVRETLGEMRTRLVWPDPTRTRIVAKNLSKSVYADEVVQACRNSFRDATAAREDGSEPASNLVYVPVFSGDHSSSILVQVPLAREFAAKGMDWDAAAEMVAGWLGLDLLGVDPKRSSLTCFEAPSVAMSGVEVDADGRRVVGDDGKAVRGHNYVGVVWNTAPGANNEAFIGSAFTYGYASARLHAMAKDPNAAESKFHMMSAADDPTYGPSFSFNKALYLTHADDAPGGGKFVAGSPLRMLSDFAAKFVKNPKLDSLTITDADAVKIGLANNKTLGPDNGKGEPGSLMTLILEKVSAYMAAGNAAPSGGFDAKAIDDIVGKVKWLDFTGRRDRESELLVSQVLAGASVEVVGETDGGQMLALTWQQDNVMAFTAANVAHPSVPTEGPMSRNYVMDMLALNRTLETHSANVADPGLVRLPENVADTVSAFALAGACLAQDERGLANLLAADEEYVNAMHAARGLVEGGQIHNEFARSAYSAWARKHLLSSPIEGVDAALNSNAAWIGKDGRAHSHSSAAWFNDLLQGPRAIGKDARAFWGANKRHAICNVNCSAKGFRYGLYVDAAKLAKEFGRAPKSPSGSVQPGYVTAVEAARAEYGGDEAKYTAAVLEAVVNAIESETDQQARNALRMALGRCLYDHHGTALSDRKWTRKARRRDRRTGESTVVEETVVAALDVSFRDLFYRGPDGKLKFDRAAVHGGMHDSKGNVVPYLAGTMFGFPRTPSYNGSMWAQVVRAGIPVTEVELGGEGQWVAGYDAAVAPDPYTLAILGCDHDGDKAKLYMLSSDYTEYSPDAIFKTLEPGLAAVASARTDGERAAAAKRYAEDLVRRGYARYATDAGKPAGLEFTPSFRRAMSDWTVRTLFDMNRALPVPTDVDGATVTTGESRDERNAGSMFGSTKATLAPSAEKGAKDVRGTWDQALAEAGEKVLDAGQGKLLKVPSVSAAVQTSAGQAAKARAIVVGINRALHVAFASGLRVGPLFGDGGANAGRQFVDFMYHLDGLANMTFDDLKHQICARLGFTPYMVETVVARMLADGRPLSTDREFMDAFAGYVKEVRQEGSLMSLLAKASEPADYAFRIAAYREVTGKYPYIGDGRRPPAVGAQALGDYLGQDRDAPVTGDYETTSEPKSGTALALAWDSVKTLPEARRAAAWAAVYDAVANSGSRAGSAGLGAALFLGRMASGGKAYGKMQKAGREAVDSVVKWAYGLSFIQEAKRFRNLVDWASSDPLSATSASGASRERESWNMTYAGTSEALDRMHAARQLFNGGVAGETAAMKGVRLAAARPVAVDALVRAWGDAEAAPSDPAVAELMAALAAAPGLDRYDTMALERAVRSTPYAFAAFLTMPEASDGTSSLTKANAWDALYAAGRALAARRNADNPGANLTLNVRRFVEAAVETLARLATSDPALHRLAPVFDFIRMVPDAGKYQYDPARYGGAATGLSRIVPALGHVTEDQLDAVRAVVDRVLAGELDGKGLGLSTKSLEALAKTPAVRGAVGNHVDGAKEGRASNVASDVDMLKAAFEALDGVNEDFTLEPSAVFGQLLPLYAALTSTVDGPVGEGTHSLLALFPDYVQAWEAKVKELSDGPARALFDAACAVDFSSGTVGKKASPVPLAESVADRMGTRGASAEGVASDLKKAAGAPSERENPLIGKLESSKTLAGVPSRLSDPDFRGTVAAFDDVRGLLFSRALQAFAGRIDLSSFSSETGLPAPAMSPTKAPAEAPATSPNGHDSTRFKGEAGARETLSSERTILSSEELDRWNERWNAEGKPGKPRILTASEHTDPAFHANQILKMLEGKEPVLEWSVRMGDGSPGAKIQSSLDARDRGETLNPVEQINARDFQFTPLEDAATWNDGTPLYRKSRRPVPVSEYREVNGVKGFYEAFLRPANTKPSDYQGLYLITKHDGLPMLKLLQTKIPKFIHFSVTTLGGSKFEPGVMHYQDLLARVEDYLKQGLDPKDVTIRIDPIVPDVTKLGDVENVIRWCKEHNIGRVRFSILDWYANSARALRDNCGYDYAQHGYTWTTNAKGKRVMALRQDRMQAILDKMVEIADRYGVTLSTCAENLRGLKGADRVKEDGCLSVAEINRVLGTHIADLGKANSRQREECSCYGGKVDMLAYDAKCHSACMYCYARHTKESPLRYYNEDGTLKDNDLTRTREGGVSPAKVRVAFTTDNSHRGKDETKFNKLGGLTKFIGFGPGSTGAYAKTLAAIANQETYTADDIVGVSVNGKRSDRVPVRGTDVERLVRLACAAGATIIADEEKNRTDYNVGERELAELLRELGYSDTNGDGVWRPSAAPVAPATDLGVWSKKNASLPLRPEKVLNDPDALADGVYNARYGGFRPGRVIVMTTQAGNWISAEVEGRGDRELRVKYDFKWGDDAGLYIEELRDGSWMPVRGVDPRDEVKFVRQGFAKVLGEGTIDEIIAERNRIYTDPTIRNDSVEDVLAASLSRFIRDGEAPAVDTSADDEAAAQEELFDNLVKALQDQMGLGEMQAGAGAVALSYGWNLLRRIEEAEGVKGFATAEEYMKAATRHGVVDADANAIKYGLRAEALLSKQEAEPETPDPLPSEEDKSYHPEVAAVADRMRAVMRLWDAGNVVYNGGTKFKIVGKFHRTGLASGDAAFDTEIEVSVEDRPSEDTPLTDAQVLTALAKTGSTMTLEEFRALPGATQAAYLSQWAASGRYIAGFRRGTNVAFSVTPEALGVVTGRISLYRGADGKFDPADNSMFHEFFHAAMSFVRAVGGMTAEDVKVLRDKYGDHPAMSGWFNEEKAADDFRRIVEDAEEVPEAVERGEKAEKGPKGVLSRILFMLRSLYDALFRFARGQSSSDYANEMEESPLLAIALTGRVRQSYPTGARRMDFDSKLDYAVTRYLSRLDQAYERINSSETGEWQFKWLQKLRGTVNDPRNPLPVPRTPNGLLAETDEELDEAAAGTRANHVYPPGVRRWAGTQGMDEGAARELVDSWRRSEYSRAIVQLRSGTRGVRGGNPYVGARYAGQTTGWTREELILNAIDPGGFQAGRVPASAVEALVSVLDRLREIGNNPDAKERRRLIDELEGEYETGDPFGASLIRGVGKFLADYGPSYRVDGKSELADAVADGTVSGNWTDDPAIAYDVETPKDAPVQVPDYGDEIAMADMERALPKLHEVVNDVRSLRMNRPYTKPYMLASRIGAAIASRFGDAASASALNQLTQYQRDAKLDEIGKVAETAARETLQLFGWKVDDQRVRNVVFSAMVSLYSGVQGMVNRTAGGRVGEKGPHARNDQDTKTYASAYDLVGAVASSTGALPRDMAEAGLDDLRPYYRKYKDGSTFRTNVLDRCAAVLERTASADPAKLVTDVGYLEDVIGQGLSEIRAGLYDGPRGPNGEFGDFELATPVVKTVNPDAIGDDLAGVPGNIALYADHIGNPDFHKVIRATVSKLYAIAASVKFYRQIGLQPGRPEDTAAIRALAPDAPEPLTVQDAMSALNVDPKRLDEPGYEAVDFYSQPWFMAQHPDAWLDSLVRPRFGMVDLRESQMEARDSCAGLQRRVRLARGFQDRMFAMDVLPGDAPTSFRVVEGPSFRLAGGVTERDEAPEYGPRIRFDGYGGSRSGRPTTVNGARWVSLFLDSVRVWATGSRKLLTGVDGITFSVNDSADVSHYEFEKVQARAREAGGIAGGYSDFDRALLRLMRQWHDDASGEHWDGVTGQAGLNMYNRLVESACNALSRAKELNAGGRLAAEDVNSFVISRMVADGLVAAKYVKQHGAKSAREAVVCLDVDEIDNMFHKSDNEGYSVLLSAGRKPEWLTRESAARPMLALAAEAKRFVDAHPWLSDGDGAFFHDLTTPLMFVRGSGHFMYQANRRERMKSESLTGAREAFETSFMELMDANSGDPVPEGSDAVPLIVRTLFHTDQKDAESIRSAIRRGECAKYGIPAHATVGDVLQACYKKLLELEWAENGDPSLKAAGGPSAVSRVAAAYERRRRDADSAGNAPLVSGGRGMTDEIMYNMTGCLPANHQLGYAVQHMVDGLTNAIAFRGAVFNMMTTPDREGMPVCVMDPSETAVRDGGITDAMWGAAARWWDEQFKTKLYDPAKTGVENAHEVFRAVKARHGKDKGWGHLNPGDIDVPSVAGVMARKTVPDGESSLDYLGGGYALGYAKHLFQSTRALGTGWRRELIHRAWAYSKSLSVSFSFFFPIATRFESPIGAMGAIATLGGNFAPDALRKNSESLKGLRKILHMDSGWITKDFIGQRDVFDMMDSDDPYLADLVEFASSIGLTLSDASVNVLEQQRGIMQQDLERSVGWVRRTYGAKAAKNWKGFMHAVFTRGGERAFTYHLNATKLAVAAQMVQMLRAEAASKGLAFDPVRDLRRYVPYLNAEIGGVDPLEYAWAHPGAQNLLSTLMFSWNWTRGAWEAGGGKLIEQVLFGGHAVTPEERNYYLGRWLRMGLWVVYGLPFVMQVLCKGLAVAIDPDHDDVEGKVDPWFTWQNESRGWLSSFDMTPLLRAVGKRFPSYAEWASRHPLLASVPLYAGMILSKKPLLAAGTAMATPWQSPDSRDKRRRYGHLGKQVHELYGWFDDPFRTFASKLSMPVQRLAEGVLGRSLSFMDRELEWSKMGAVERWFGGGATTNFLKAFLPMSLAGLVDAEGGGGGLTAFFPVRKGISQYAATKQIQERLDQWASNDRKGYAPGKLPRRAEGKKNFSRFAVENIPTVARLVREAMHNGVSEKNAYHLVAASLQELTRQRYHRLGDLMPYKADESYDVPAVSRVVRELSRLGRATKDLLNAYQRRLEATERWHRMDADARRRGAEIIRAARGNPYGTEPVAPVEPSVDY